MVQEEKESYYVDPVSFWIIWPMLRQEEREMSFWRKDLLKLTLGLKDILFVDGETQKKVSKIFQSICTVKDGLSYPNMSLTTLM